ncbi:tRNA uridine-5-carboxymethylaminomethyl(34) synthesis GTPase MnmE [Gilvimarinus sp. SDUM040013]|uniref:tRNA modification GTPase MnmE n=1 Tax=Gilvimarinus gilvus TaxID=3058038 RepID=A0ABU4RVI0_9GAMM|nr:tRNA uridine-5-carboxymethylaminomethyl(34) synthesis GTPase MnmE [Gilvimarinus sp. SDUM040013]MDO3387682.1 tRNA uridine-5-carboxymethylaminomethyl(34) synthesis GTPase MnmE [Gilvimarinus sp. SDUM040013]MDX6848877.1 tRNA uridine-5-carboxymethylaminomethyl(34) synthesis GTPase MnmE [Gilvimarinus sp. SDUM040013]
MLPPTDTIAAVATATGRGGVGIVRVSGPQAPEIAKAITKATLTPRQAHYLPFWDENTQELDRGIALLFSGPNSFTGEDILELQGHGGPIVLGLLLERVKQLGARQARPGEFSERAFLNDKLDLAQAEAIADLIEASSEQAARNALNSLQGLFSNQVHALVESLIAMRIYVEAAIDFPEEEIDFLSDGKVAGDLTHISESLVELIQQARQGQLVRDGMQVVIAGKPNAGKSSLLNALVERDSAIVTDIAGTTRDVLKEHIHIDGMPLHIIDTAGLREASDQVEKIGIERAWAEIEKADRILLMIDAVDAINHPDWQPENVWPEFTERLKHSDKVSVIYNKVDLADTSKLPDNALAISAKTGQGLKTLKQHLKDCIGYQSTTEATFTARQRHIDALLSAQRCLQQGEEQLQLHAAGELLAEDLRDAQNYLSEITGEFTSDDLLGRIFSSFCIGK